MRFDYFYGKESDMMSFYRVPKLLIKDQYFRELDNEAKFLYGLLLDRMDLSAKNGWYDDKHRVFIVYSQKSLMEDMNRGRNKISDMLNDLERYGLIERVKGKKYMPDKIYVKMYIDQQAERSQSRNVMPEMQTLKQQSNMIRIIPAKRTSGSMENYSLPESATDDQEIGEDYTDVMFANETPEENAMFETQTSPCLNYKHMMFETQTPSCLDSKHTDVYNSNANHTENNNTEYSHTESNHILSAGEKTDGMGSDEDERAYREVVEENIDAEVLYENFPDDVGIIKGIIDLIVDKLTSAKEEIIVCGEPRGANVVKGRLMKLNRFHIEYVLDCWNRLPEPPRKPDQYLLAMLYNASSTSDAQLKAQLNRDYPQYNSAFNVKVQ